MQLLVHLFLLEDIESILSERVDVTQKLDILVLDALVGICMDLFALSKRRSHMFNILLHRLSHLCLLNVLICIADLVLIGLLEYVDSMQALDSLFELLIVVQVIVEHFIDFVLELLLLESLLSDLLY